MPKASSDEILQAGNFLAERGFYGLVWLDDRLVPLKRLGGIAAFVPIGIPLTEGVASFTGLEDDLAKLKSTPDRSLAIPNVRLDARDRDSPRVNLAIYWMVPEQQYLLLVARAVSRTDLDVALAAQVRARSIAEADLVAKSQLIARANEELTRINDDLQAFASIISHDLRSPLRALRYFAGDAREAVATGDGDAAAERLEMVIGQARRMTGMLSGLLEYSRIGRKSDAVEPVDTGALVQEIVASVPRPAGITVNVQGDWPVVDTVLQPLDITLRNLLENAIRHHDRAQGYIGLCGAVVDGTLQISVRDDGPGIPVEWHQAIFEPFRRIGDESDVKEGSGMGLALVRKAVQAVGGSIEVISDPAVRRGTEFRLSWPLAARQE